ncbi:MAG: Flagellar hook-basal body complex protein FliE [Alphaproteobacteria bacterium MarineAlpha3_Bin7]|jgi:flagellar hook-basal body complex protein FliE|nr:flagellar hook-basal body complex protein FliE [Rhodospirillaceae bacterium]PPR65797.1 MAG: Flagellar hook-basal body complex protein FliE [Alphaproteobacteria bacterium MarineAlpha3_Bin7]|tara:strand:- start:616 stop:936 length:321 start_codon:yes stop_codon:yes gene_type:complete
MSIESASAIKAYNQIIDNLKNTPEGKSSSNVSPKSTDFSQMVKDFAEKAVETGKKSETQSIAAAAGKADLNSVVVAVAEAELTLNTVVAVRNKVIESYREILRMPI